MVVHISDQSGKTIGVPCSPDETSQVFRPIVEDAFAASWSCQRLLFGGRRLSSDQKLSSYSIKHGDTIWMALEQVGGGRYAFANVSDESALEELEFYKTAPDWRGCDVGLNLEGRCETPDCAAFGKMVIWPKGFESFNIVKDGSIPCPKCWSKVKPLTCGFYDCAWKFEGVKADGGVPVSSPWRDANGQKYHRFDADENNRSVKWESLLIVVMERGMLTAAQLTVDKKLKREGEVELCTICWSKMLPKSRTTTQCGHRFHRGCLGKWTERCKNHASLPASSCPICRQAL